MNKLYIDVVENHSTRAHGSLGKSSVQEQGLPGDQNRPFSPWILSIDFQNVVPTPVRNCNEGGITWNSIHFLHSIEQFRGSVQSNPLPVVLSDRED